MGWKERHSLRRHYPNRFMGSMDLIHPLSRTSAPPKVGLGPASRDSIGHVIGGTGRFQETIIGVNLLTSDLSVLCGNMRAIRGWPAPPFTWRTRRIFRPPSHDPALQDRDLSRFSRGRLSPGESRAFSIRRRVDRGRRHRIETPACRRRGNGRHSLEGPLSARGESLASTETVPAPAGQGAMREHTGSM